MPEEMLPGRGAAEHQVREKEWGTYSRGREGLSTAASESGDLSGLGPRPL